MTNEMNEERAFNRGHELAFPIDVAFPSHNGLTKREWMATQIMTGFLSHGHDVRTSVEYSIDAVDKLLIALHINEKK